MLQIFKYQKRKNRQYRSRKKLFGSQERPRLHVQRTHLHLYAQAIDDYQERTLAASSTLSPELRKKNKKQWGNVESAKEFGKHLAELLKQKKIEQIVFDCSGFPYHGRLRAFAEALRESGIRF